MVVEREEAMEVAVGKIGGGLHCGEVVEMGDDDLLG